MKHLIKPIMILITWPFVAVALLFLLFSWLVLHCWGCKDKDFMAADEIHALSYSLWHLKKRPEPETD